VGTRERCVAYACYRWNRGWRGDVGRVRGRMDVGMPAGKTGTVTIPSEIIP
jgi:hypothetical protein